MFVIFIVDIVFTKNAIISNSSINIFIWIISKKVYWYGIHIPCCDWFPEHHLKQCSYQTVLYSVAKTLPLHMWPDLLKGVLYTYSFKKHFSLPLVSFINGPTAHVFNIAEGQTVCFHSGLFLKPVHVRYPWVPGWPLNGPIFPWQADSRLWFTTRPADSLSMNLAALCDM